MNTDTDHYVDGWDEALALVKDKWPEAIHEGVGHWRIPRVARIWYTGNPEQPERGRARVRYEPMGR